MYSLRSIPGNGLGLIAVRNIVVGTRILVDEPLVSIADSTLDEGIEQRISAALAQLPTQQLQEFEALHCPNHAGLAPQTSRFLGNAVEMEPGSAGVFSMASRINHSCGANALSAWNSNLHRLTVHAMAYINQGEEITVNYDVEYLAYANRRQRLLDFYGFRCRCSVCRRELIIGHEGPSKRERMEDLAKDIEDFKLGRRNDNKEELQIIVEFLTLADDEDLNGQFVSGLYGRASSLYEARGSLGLAVQYAEVEFENASILLGSDNPLTISAHGTVEILKANQSKWGVNEDEDEESVTEDDEDGGVAI